MDRILNSARDSIIVFTLLFFFGSFQNSQPLLKSANKTMSEDSCTWTVRVWSEGFGDETEWTLSDSSGVILSGGPYLTPGYEDVQTISAEGPLEFTANTKRFINDNILIYEISNENGVVAQGSVPGKHIKTISNLECSDMPSPDVEGDGCGQGNESDLDKYYNSLDISMNNERLVADDFFVPAGETLNIKTIELNLLSVNYVKEVEIHFYDDDGNGQPGQIRPETVSASLNPGQQALNHKLGYNAYRIYTVYVDTDLSFEEGHYWMEVKAKSTASYGGVRWENTYEGNLGRPTHLMNEDGNWEPVWGYQGIFTLHCETTPPLFFNWQDCGENLNDYIDISFAMPDITMGSDYRSADDFTVTDDQPLRVKQIQLFVESYSEIEEVKLTFYNNSSSNRPGTVIPDKTTIVPIDSFTRTEQILSGEGYKVFIDVDLEFEQGTYWLQPEVRNTDNSQVRWYVNYDVIGSPVHGHDGYSWYPDYGNMGAVFSVLCNRFVSSNHADPCMGYEVKPISYVKMANVENYSSPVSGGLVEDFRDIRIYVNAGETYEVIVEGNTGGNITDYVTLFIELGTGYWVNTQRINLGSISNSTGTDGIQLITDVTIPINLEGRVYPIKIFKEEGHYPQYAYCEEVGQSEIYSWVVTEAEECDGIPEAGEIMIDPPAAAPGSAYTVKSYGHSVAKDIKYQWESNENNNGWNTAGNALSTYEHHHATAPADGTTVKWRLKITCVNSGEIIYSDEAVFTSDATMGMEDMELSEFNFYPNPVKDKLHLVTNKNIDRVEVYNLEGQRLINDISKNKEVDFTKLTPGVYAVRIIFEDGKVQSFKVVKR